MLVYDSVTLITFTGLLDHPHHFQNFLVSPDRNSVPAKQSLPIGPSLQPLVTSHPPSVSACCGSLHVNGIIEYLALRVWFLSLNIRFSRFTQ